jgi:hypothetical protein
MYGGRSLVSKPSLLNLRKMTRKEKSEKANEDDNEKKIYPNEMKANSFGLNDNERACNDR